MPCSIQFLDVRALADNIQVLNPYPLFSKSAFGFIHIQFLQTKE